MWKIIAGLVMLSSSRALPLEITVVYNNVPFNDKLTTNWGMSCLVKGLEKTILFDTGGDGAILLDNMKRLSINPDDIDCVFLSHDHYDHTGGLQELLKRNSKLIVCLLNSFSEDTKNIITANGAQYREITDKTYVCEKAATTGELGTSIKEQSLIIETPKGLIVITGCAHPGIVEIARTARDLCDGSIYLLLGGFHLMTHSDKQVREIIQELREIGVQKIGPSHCTGDRAIQLFEKSWGTDFLNLGCGAIFRLDTTK